MALAKHCSDVYRRFNCGVSANYGLLCRARRWQHIVMTILSFVISLTAWFEINLCDVVVYVLLLESWNVCKKGKVFPYSLPSVGPGADPGVQAVSPQVT